MGQIKLIVGLLMVALFAISIISFVTQVGDDNDSNVELGSEFSTVKSNIRTNTTNFRSDSNSISELSSKTTIEEGSDSSKGGAEVKIGLTSLLGTLGSIFGLVNSYIFSNTPAFTIFTTALGAVLLYIGILYYYKTFKGGNPD